MVKRKRNNNNSKKNKKFKFDKIDDRKCMYNPNLGFFQVIPQPILLIIFDNIKDDQKTIRALRSTCILFFNISISFWKPQVELKYLGKFFNYLKDIGHFTKLENLYIFQYTSLPNYIRITKTVGNALKIIPIKNLELNFNSEVDCKLMHLLNNYSSDFFDFLPSTITDFTTSGLFVDSKFFERFKNLKRLTINDRHLISFYHVIDIILFLPKNVLVRFSNRRSDTHFLIYDEWHNVITAGIKFFNANTTDKLSIKQIQQIKTKIIENKDLINEMVDDRNPLMEACTCGDLEFVRLLLENGANPRMLDDNPLCIACRIGIFDIVSVLVEMGADIEKPDKKGTPPLVYACLYFFPRVVEFLLSRGANPNVDSPYGHPLILLSKRTKFIAFKNHGLQLVKTLLDYKADPNKKDNYNYSYSNYNYNYNYTPLNYFLNDQAIECVELMLQYGAKHLESE
jgi:hypothetical protein